MLPLPALFFSGWLRASAPFFAFALWQMLPAFFAFACLLRTLRDQRVLPREQRVARCVLVAAAACICIGDALFFGSHNGIFFRESGEAFQFWSRAPYILGNVLLFLSLLALLITERLEERVRAALDALLLTACAGLILAHFTFLPILRNASGVRPILAIYGAMSLAMLCLSLFVLSSSRSEPLVLRARALLCMALVLIVLSNSILLIAPAFADVFRWTSVGQYIWGVAMLTLGMSALQARSSTLRVGTDSLFRVVQTLPTLLPVAYMLVAIGLISVGLSGSVLARGGDIDARAVWAGTGVLILLALRQFVVAFQNTRSRNALVQLNAQLDEMVALRTRQLHEQTNFASRLNGATRTSHVRDVILESAPRLLFPHVYALWLRDDEDDENGALALVSTNAFPADVEKLEQIDPRNPPRRPNWLQVVPVEFGRHCFGYIGAQWQGAHDAVDVQQLEFLAREAALALHNSSLLEHALIDAERDSVTGLLNHRGVQNRMERAFEHAQDESLPLTLAFMDLDRFKLFNDTYSTAVGDLVLKHIARFLRDELQLPEANTILSLPGDAAPEHPPGLAVAGRVGGDEFWMILPGLDRQSALERVAQINANLQRSEFRLPGKSDSVPIAVSFGVAVYPEDATGLQRLISIAEAQLRGAKNSGLAVRSSTSIERMREELRDHDSFEALDAIVAAIDAKDAYTRAHSEEVTEYALELAQFLGLSDATFKMLRTGAILHDIGKIAVPSEILCKPGALSPEEFNQMKTHPWIGAILVSALPGLGNVVEIVRSHHERYDGTGYPDKLKAEAIPMMARVLAVADAYSAMTCNRPYRRALDEDEALRRIEEGAGTQFDPNMARAWVQMRREMLARAANAEE